MPAATNGAGATRATPSVAWQKRLSIFAAAGGDAVRNSSWQCPRAAHSKKSLSTSVITAAGLDVVKRGDTRQGRGPRLQPKGLAAVQNDCSDAAARPVRHGASLDARMQCRWQDQPWGAGNTAARASAIVGPAVATRRSTPCENGGANRR